MIGCPRRFLKISKSIPNYNVFTNIFLNENLSFGMSDLLRQSTLKLSDLFSSLIGATEGAAYVVIPY